MLEFAKGLKEITRGDMKIEYGEITFSTNKCVCGVANCKSKPIYNIQFFKPDNFSNAGGAFCKYHIKSIFDIDVEN